ncbi:MAG: SIMPL domain-containing protein [Alphaproteobacteria bacterium]|nr:SIMPL domain-containing protein [Alphaproteobacteria bacterium]
MRVSILVVAVAGMLAGAPLAVAQTAAPLRTIAVSGYAEVQATPDRAQVSAGVVTQGQTAAAAVEQNSTAMRGVFAALRAAGVAEADIRTAGFNVSPVFDEVKGPRQAPRIVAYQVGNTVTALVRDTATLGDTLDALVKGGANTLHGVSFFVARDEELQDRLRVEAVKDAQRKAAMMAEAAGATLGPVMTIAETGRGGAPVPMARLQASAMSVPVAAGTETLATTVSVTFELR